MVLVFNFSESTCCYTDGNLLPLSPSLSLPPSLVMCSFCFIFLPQPTQCFGYCEIACHMHKHISTRRRVGFRNSDFKFLFCPPSHFSSFISLPSFPFFHRFCLFSLIQLPATERSKLPSGWGKPS